MGPVLTGLMKLQEVENKLRGMNSKLARAKRSVTLQENLLRNLTNSLEAKKHDIQLSKMDIDKLELELKSRDDSLTKYRTALNTAKNNKEYAAILTEINLAKADNSKIENQILDIMKNIEQEEAECKEIKEQIEAQNSKVEEVRAESQIKIDAIEAELSKVQAEWDATAKDVPADALDLFKRLSDTYDGEAIALIEQADARRSIYSCGGCYMSITNETVNQLLTKDEIIQCPSCSRIVILNESFE